MRRIIPVLLSLLLLAGCGGGEKEASYQQISQEEAKEMMDTQEVIILDVREQDEYDSGHIPDAVLLPVGTIDEDTAAAVIPEKDSMVLVYCRSGNRSKTASSALAELPKTKNVLAKTKRECQEKLKQLINTLGSAKREKVRPDMPFGEWMDFWYQNYAKPWATSSSA